MTRRYTKAKYRLIEFVRPGSYWPYPYSIEQAFGAWRWMVSTAMQPKYRTQRGCCPALATVGASPGRVRRLEHVAPFGSLEELRERFQYAMFLAGGPECEQWRKDYGIHQDGVVTLAFPHHRLTTGPVSQAVAMRRMEALWRANGTLTTQLNSCHADAVECYGAPLHLCEYSTGGKAELRWAFGLRYGVDGSAWTEWLAMQKPKESLWEVFVRAEKRYKELTG